MKFLFITTIITLFAYNASAQTNDTWHKTYSTTPLSGKQIINHIGSNVYVCDTICGYKVHNTALKFVYVGGMYPNNPLTIIIKGPLARRFSEHNLEAWKLGGICFAGKAVLYHVASQRYL